MPLKSQTRLFPFPIRFTSHRIASPSIPYPSDVVKEPRNKTRHPDKHASQPNHHSSSPSLLPCIATCLALSASANPPARLTLPDELGVSLPLPLPPSALPFDEPMLTALSLGAGGGSGFLPVVVVGLLAGGAGGVGLALATGRAAVPLVETPLVMGGGGGT